MKYPAQIGQIKRNAVLLFNDKESLFIYNKVGLDSVRSSVSMEAQENNKRFNSILIKVSPLDEKGQRIYRDFSKKNIVFRVPKLPPIEPYTVQDNWVEIPWELKNEYKTISGWKCQKAIGDFRGRRYVVWFAKGIPFPYGPWKLFGLPGLILEAKDTTGEIYMRIKSLCQPCGKKIEIEKPREPEQKTLREYVEFNDHIPRNVEGIMKSKIEAYTKKVKKTSGRNINIQLNLVNPRDKNEIADFRKKQLEIIYGWENAFKNTDNIPFKKKDTLFKK